MVRTFAIVAAFAASALSLGVSVQPAYAQAPVVRAVTVAQLAPKTLVAGETLWNCGAEGCTTRALTSRPAIVCAQVAKQVGAVSSFSVGGAALSAEELAKCNAKAKGGETALASK
ncbi:hypothetical protein SPAN111604_03155 [Sphingomonas antarctica]|uniref:CC_3452 family protein n=1 Tax=Sphingomonas antarctica TaxID=2040274 RepID=UPI0039E7B4C1